MYDGAWPFIVTEAPGDKWAVVYLNDGTIYRGNIHYYTFDPNSEDYDFVLTDAFKVKDDLEEIYEVDGFGVYLSTKNVIRVEFLRGEVFQDGERNPSLTKHNNTKTAL